MRFRGNRHRNHLKNSRLSRYRELLVSRCRDERFTLFCSKGLGKVVKLADYEVLALLLKWLGLALGARD